MQIVIPMSGAGARFSRKGYSRPKPLIEVDGKPLIEHVVDMFPGATDFVFICSRQHLETTPMESVLRSIAPRAAIASIEPHKRGPVHAVLAAEGLIEDNSPVLVSYCDFATDWDFRHFKSTVALNGCDGCITAYRGFHPHSLGPNLYAYMRHSENHLLEIREKHCFTGDRMQEFASAGSYYMRSGRLLKHYFHQAVDKDLATNGEYYASMPFNLLVADGLDVRIYELPHFLQWGTPEDLEEYVGWSEYFRHWEDWRPPGRALPGVNLLPAAGRGVRFQREGYRKPKPLIPVGGVPMIQRVAASSPPAKRWIVVSRETEAAALSQGLELAGVNKIESIQTQGNTEGQLCTCLLARDRIDPAEPLAIYPCDAALIYDDEAFRRLALSGTADVIVWTFRNHPHANRHPEQYGWVDADSDGAIRQVLCKQPLHEDVSGDPGVVGAFWFRKAGLFFEAADRVVRANLRVNNEFYVDTVAGELVRSGARGRVFGTKHYICMGTPDDIRTYEYWRTYFRSQAGTGERERVEVCPSAQFNFP
jgi:NDP-sugar pyrophosphorylase family protein